jgi:hypothetical protein
MKRREEGEERGEGGEAREGVHDLGRKRRRTGRREGEREENGGMGG